MASMVVLALARSSAGTEGQRSWFLSWKVPQRGQGERGRKRRVGVAYIRIQEYESFGEEIKLQKDEEMGGLKPIHL